MIGWENVERFCDMTPEEREAKQLAAQYKTAGICELAMDNPNLASYMEHWEGRATQAEFKLEQRQFADKFDAPHDEALRKVVPSKYLGWSLKGAAADYIREIEIKLADLNKIVDAADYLQHCRRSEPAFDKYSRNYAANEARIKRASDHYDFLRGQVKL